MALLQPQQVLHVTQHKAIHCFPTANVEASQVVYARSQQGHTAVSDGHQVLLYLTSSHPAPPLPLAVPLQGSHTHGKQGQDVPSVNLLAWNSSADARHALLAVASGQHLHIFNLVDHQQHSSSTTAGDTSTDNPTWQQATSPGTHMPRIEHVATISVTGVVRAVVWHPTQSHTLAVVSQSQVKILHVDQDRHNVFPSPTPTQENHQLPHLHTLTTLGEVGAPGGRPVSSTVLCATWTVPQHTQPPTAATDSTGTVPPTTNRSWLAVTWGTQQLEILQWDHNTSHQDSPTDGHTCGHTCGHTSPASSSHHETPDMSGNSTGPAATLSSPPPTWTCTHRQSFTWPPHPSLSNTTPRAITTTLTPGHLLLSCDLGLQLHTTPALTPAINQPQPPSASAPPIIINLITETPPETTNSAPSHAPPHASRLTVSDTLHSSSGGLSLGQDGGLNLGLLGGSTGGSGRLLIEVTASADVKPCDDTSATKCESSVEVVGRRVAGLGTGVSGAGRLVEVVGSSGDEGSLIGPGMVGAVDGGVGGEGRGVLETLQPSQLMQGGFLASLMVSEHISTATTSSSGNDGTSGVSAVQAQMLKVVDSRLSGKGVPSGMLVDSTAKPAGMLALLQLEVVVGSGQMVVEGGSPSPTAQPRLCISLMDTVPLLIPRASHISWAQQHIEAQGNSSNSTRNSTGGGQGSIDTSRHIMVAVASTSTPAMVQLVEISPPSTRPAPTNTSTAALQSPSIAAGISAGGDVHHQAVHAAQCGEEQLRLRSVVARSRWELRTCALVNLGDASTGAATSRLRLRGLDLVWQQQQHLAVLDGAATTRERSIGLCSDGSMAGSGMGRLVVHVFQGEHRQDKARGAGVGGATAAAPGAAPAPFFTLLSRSGPVRTPLDNLQLATYHIPPYCLPTTTAGAAAAPGAMMSGDTTALIGRHEDVAEEMMREPADLRHALEFRTDGARGAGRVRDDESASGNAVVQGVVQGGSGDDRVVKIMRLIRAERAFVDAQFAALERYVSDMHAAMRMRFDDLEDTLCDGRV